MPEIYLFASLSRHGGAPLDIRYLHATRETTEEAKADCEDLNRLLVSAEFRVVEDDE